jgi:branched-chain amino acid transport system permease protein
MTEFLQTLTDGLTVGALYALIALGYTMVYGILKFINFAHSDVFALGVHLSIVIASLLGIKALGETGTPPWYMGALVLVLAMLACGAIGFLVERLAYKPLRSAPRLNVLITAIGVSLLFQNAGQLPWAFGVSPKPWPTLLPDGELFSIAGVRFRLVHAVVLVTAVALMVALQYLIYRTKLGSAMRAVSYNTRTAALMGINVNGIISFTFVVGSMLAAAGGFLYGVYYGGQMKQTADSMWVMLGLKAFVAAVVGGIGNVRGAVLGGLMIGLIEFFGVQYVSDQYRDAYVFAILILVLLFKPEGVFGKATVEKV